MSSTMKIFVSLHLSGVLESALFGFQKGNCGQLVKLANIPKMAATNYLNNNHKMLYILSF